MSEREWLEGLRPEDRQVPDRYRIYRVRGGKAVCVCTVETLDAIGAAIVDQRDPEAGATIEPDDRIGILDRPYEGETGEWIINPWARG